MKKLNLFILLCFTLTPVSVAKGWNLFKSAHHPKYEQLQTGDIVFQDTGSAQGEAVTAATGSSFTHCGVVLEKEGRLYVFEAVQPVQLIPLKAWKVRSKIFHARRLKNTRPLNNDSLLRAIAWGQKQLGKDYDLNFRWSDQNMYCSELVWKVYKQATGQQLCAPQTFDSYDLQNTTVLKIIQQRYGALENLPKTEFVVAPSDLANSIFLEEVPRKNQKKQP
ncbi:YiiX/YebB-like N1pC/P60 family cysteine hydrolase [Akkermansiaceae bacterium]|nr:YiiX/YebB-like N1pC/P60 family cysteine hydrolase [Akkermansiaceae bacterium]